MVAGIKPRASVYLRKAQAEVAALAERGIVAEGNAFSPVLLIKGEPGPAEQAGKALLSGADGTALRAALLKLGYAPEEQAALATWCADGGPLAVPDLRLALATLDPNTAVVCDERAADLVREAYTEELFALDSPDEALLAPGLVVRVGGIRVLNLGGFEAALADDRQKQVMWARLKLVPPWGEPY